MDIKGQIVGMSNSGESARQIGRELDVPHTTVSYYQVVHIIPDFEAEKKRQ